MGQTGFALTPDSKRTISSVYRLAVTDLWSPAIQWAGDGKIDHPDQGATIVTFTIPENTSVGTTVAKKLTVTAIDGAFSATADLTIGITVIGRLPHLPSQSHLPRPRTES